MMKNNETIEKEFATASLKAAVDLIQGIDAGLTIGAMRTRMGRVAEDIMEAACEKVYERDTMSIEDRIRGLEERLKIIEDRHTDRVDAMHEVDEAMEEASELEHGQY